MEQSKWYYSFKPTNIDQKWTNEEVIKLLEVSDILWEGRIKSKINKLELKHKDYTATIKVLKDLLEE